MIGRIGRFFGLGGAGGPEGPGESGNTGGPGKPGPVQKPSATQVAPELHGDQRNTGAADRARVQALAQLDVPPILATFVEQSGFRDRIAAVRAGEPGLLASEKSAVAEQLGRLNSSQLKALREVLVERPPHPRLKEMRGHQALRGPPTAQGILQILCGEPLGKKPLPSPELVQRAENALDVAAPGLSPQDRAAWLEVLASSEAATSLVARQGPAALRAISALGVSGVEAAGQAWGSGDTLIRAGEVLPGGFGDIAKYLAQAGPQQFAASLEALGNLRWGSQIGLDGALRTLGIEGAVTVAREAEKNAHGMRAARYLAGSEAALLESLKGKGPGGVAKLFAEAASRIHSFGSNHVPLEAGGDWPAQRPRTQAIAAAEEQLARKIGLLPGAVRDRRALDDVSRGNVSREMKDQIAAADPELAAQLERELLGRRFVAPRYYDALYDAGVKNPEHRYGVHSFEAWKRADAQVKEAALQSRGRPLRKGELIEVMREAHRLAGAGIVDARESHLKPGDLGRLRSDDADHVQLGDGMVQMDLATSQRLDRNPYLSPDQIRFERDDGSNQVSRTVHFARGSDVPRFMAELDQWVRANEPRLPPHELAAEVHHRLVSIHPFMDGNGRTAKLMADFLLQRAGIEPPLWRQGDVLKNHERWGDAVREGVEVELATVERYWRTAIEQGQSKSDRSMR